MGFLNWFRSGTAKTVQTQANTAALKNALTAYVNAITKLNKSYTNANVRALLVNNRYSKNNKTIQNRLLNGLVTAMMSGQIAVQNAQQAVNNGGSEAAVTRGVAVATVAANAANAAVTAANAANAAKAANAAAATAKASANAAQAAANAAPNAATKAAANAAVAAAKVAANAAQAAARNANAVAAAAPAGNAAAAGTAAAVKNAVVAVNNANTAAAAAVVAVNNANSAEFRSRSKANIKTLLNQARNDINASNRIVNNNSASNAAKNAARKASKEFKIAEGIYEELNHYSDLKNFKSAIRQMTTSLENARLSASKARMNVHPVQNFNASNYND